MAKIYIVNHALNGGGPYVELFSTYHRDEESGAAAFEECKRSASEDPNLIELVCLDTDTMETTHITGWEGTSDDLDVLHEEEDEDDDWIVEGKPDADL